MSPETVELFYAILALLAAGALGTLLVIRLLAIGSTAARGWYEAIQAFVRPNALSMAFLVALVATLGSLYFSEVAHFEPCRLCWYQRIAMYPLAVILGIAAVRRDRGIRVYGMALAAIGAVIATYHVALEWIPALDTGACGLGPSCSVVWFRTFGFISLPTLALIAFLSILALLAMGAPDPDEPAHADDPTDQPTDERSHP
jgi:disulfide bond formation protein DsbB